MEMRCSPPWEEEESAVGAPPANHEMGCSPAEAPSSVLAHGRLGLSNTRCFSSFSATLMAELLESFSLYSWVSVCSGSAVCKAPALSESICRVLESLGSWIPVKWLWGWSQVVINTTYCCLGIWRSHTQVPSLLGTCGSALLPLGRHPYLGAWGYRQSSVQKDIRLPHYMVWLPFVNYERHEEGRLWSIKFMDSITVAISDSRDPWGVFFYVCLGSREGETNAKYSAVFMKCQMCFPG